MLLLLVLRLTLVVKNILFLLSPKVVLKQHMLFHFPSSFFLFDDEHDPSHKRSDVMIKRIDQCTLYDGKLVSLDDIGSIIK